MYLAWGKYWPPRLCGLMFLDLGKAVGILIQLMRLIWNNGTCAFLDSGLCVLKGIIELQWRGVYSALVINKFHYWKNHIPGYEIVLHFGIKAVGSVDYM